jgi:hypothetical protein
MSPFAGWPSKAGLTIFVTTAGTVFQGAFLCHENKLRVVLKSSLFFPGDEFAHFVQHRGELVVVRFFLNANGQAIHALAFF